MSLIDFVRGAVAERGPDSVVLAVGGLGLRILTSTATIEQVPEPGAVAHLHTYLVVREEALTLYGFGTVEERGLFAQLLTVTGVGPRVALGALSAMPVAQLAAAIQSGDIKALVRIPGIGRKTAQQMVLDLKGKLEFAPVEEIAASAGVPAPTSGQFDDAATALRELGFTPAEVAAAIAALPRDQGLTDEQALRAALQAIGAPR